MKESNWKFFNNRVLVSFPNFDQHSINSVYLQVNGILFSLWLGWYLMKSDKRKGENWIDSIKKSLDKCKVNRDAKFQKVHTEFEIHDMIPPKSYT